MSSLLGLGGNIPSAAAAADFYDYQIAQSCRLNGAEYLERTYSGSPTSTTTGTLSVWFKKSANGNQDSMFTSGNGSGDSELNFRILDDNTMRLNIYDGSSQVGSIISTDLFRDTSAWYHFLALWDTSQATASNRLKMYVNGTQVTNLSDSTYPSQDQESYMFADGRKVAVGYQTWNGSGNVKGYLAEAYGIDGIAYTPSTFGTSKNGVWIPKDASSAVTFGNGGFYLKFESSGDLGNDSSGNNNDFTPSGLAAHDQMKGSPTFSSDDGNGGNFATLNPLASLAGVTFSEGNLKEADDNSGWQAMWSTMAVPSGKYYFEAEFTEGSRDRGYIGVAQSIDLATYQDSYYAGQTNNSAGWYSANGSVYINASTTGSTLNTYTTDDIVGCAIDIDNGYVYFSKNGTWEDSGDPTSGATGTGGFSLSASTSGDSWHLIVSGWGSEFIVNYGQDPSFAGSITAGTAAPDNGLGLFKYDVPADYKALCAGNLPTPGADPAEDEGPENYFKVLTPYAGGTTGHVTGFQPDLVWTKRTTAGQSNAVWDSSRGITKVLNTDASNAEATSSGLTAFNSDGYDMGTYYNQSGDSYVSWSWKANGGTTAANTTGDIDSTVQVDADRGFSIIQYTGSGTADDTVGHGLSDTPDFVIGTPLDSAGSNRVAWCNGMANTAFLKLNTTAAQATSDQIMGVSSTTIAVGGNANLSSKSQLIYCWHNVEGYSRFGRYEGNGNSNGTYIFTGHRVSWVMIKRIDSTGSWHIYDDQRNTYNPADTYLLADGAGGNDTAASNAIDLLSNGFKIRNTAAGLNASGGDYIYASFAKNPFKYAVAR